MKQMSELEKHYNKFNAKMHLYFLQLIFDEG